MSRGALDRSVLELVGTRDPLPDFGEEYTQWKHEVDSGDSGAFTIPVSMVLDVMNFTAEC
jgi:hypothetical protein